MTSKETLREINDIFDFSIGTHIIKNGHFELVYFVFEDYIQIDKIEVFDEYRGKGLGSKILKQFIDESDKDIILVILYDKPLNFYKRLGFVLESAYYDANDVFMEGTMVYKKEIENE